MLFRKKISHSCLYCARGTQMDDEVILCMKYGVVTEREKCRKFKYDPCKRIPVKAKAPDFRKFDSTDFSL